MCRAAAAGSSFAPCGDGEAREGPDRFGALWSVRVTACGRQASKWASGLLTGMLVWSPEVSLAPWAHVRNWPDAQTCKALLANGCKEVQQNLLLCMATVVTAEGGQSEVIS